MLQIRSITDVADNTGAKRAAIIGVIGRNQRYAGIGDVIKGASSPKATTSNPSPQAMAEAGGRLPGTLVSASSVWPHQHDEIVIEVGLDQVGLPMGLLVSLGVEAQDAQLDLHVSPGAQ